MKDITIVNPGKTTFKRGEVISQEAFAKENERVLKLGEKPARGMYYDSEGKAIDVPRNMSGEVETIGLTKGRMVEIRLGASGRAIPPDKPTRDDVRVELWEERDRLLVGIQDKETGEYYASWWDDNARGMFTDGFFKRGPGLEESVLQYAEEMGILEK